MLADQSFTSYCADPSASTTFRDELDEVAWSNYVISVMGLVLCFYVGSIEQPTLCMMFAAPPTTVSMVLRRAEEALSKALEGYVPAWISWPSPARQAKFAKLMRPESLSHLAS